MQIMININHSHPKITIDNEKIIKCLTEELKSVCFCQFNSLKPELSNLNDVIKKRWNEPVDVGCIE